MRTLAASPQYRRAPLIPGPFLRPGGEHEEDENRRSGPRVPVRPSERPTDPSTCLSRAVSERGEDENRSHVVFVVVIDGARPHLILGSLRAPGASRAPSTP